MNQMHLINNLDVQGRAMSVTDVMPRLAPASLSDAYFNRAKVSDSTSIEQAFVLEVEASADRQVLFASDRFVNRLVAFVEAEHERSPIEMMTFDVFDTVVLRNHKCEPRRFLEIAQRQAVFLESSAAARGCQAADLLVARLMATRASYRVRRAVQGCREGSITEIYGGMVTSLGLDDGMAAPLLDIELDYEAENTTPNPVALRLATWARNCGIRTALISDMYLHGMHIERILAAHLGEKRGLFGDLVSSADTVISKGSGRLFDQLAREHKVEARAHFHFGDNERTDFKSPISKGWRACLLPVPAGERELIRQDFQFLLAELSANGVNLGAWIKSGA